ncbi:hypothetical protein SAMN05428988_3706 [Chitinophaga sp. YR573]|uniref:hypothetical protein n=1 Tax=Chitinophaga sp. YR573 TaxID=1881040 RepID=UPI0008B28ACC|nr:hypothetical protein [Chitinophaga sp. YR573]SEW25995.1 hypothetical protein SAMN05428988_3706 [Chitinophaga sp. YR573]
MKCTLYIPILCLILFACKKDEKHTPTSTEALQGMWRLYQYWNSPGAGPVVWTPATENKTIYFSPDLSFHSYTTNQDHYLFTPGTDTSLLKIYKQGTTDTSSYFVKVTPDTLVLNFLGCIEGCSEKYIRQPLGAL